MRKRVQSFISVLCALALLLGCVPAAMAESTTVRTMVLVPPDSSEITGSTEAAKLAANAIRTKAPTTRFTRAGGMMIARNIP